VNKVAYLTAAALIGLSAGAANAAVDIAEAPTGFFVPTDAEKFDSPYYRDADEDWEWTHGAIAPGFATAELNISAFDVDTDGNGGTFPPEVDNVYAWDSGAWVLLGSLDGFGEVWEFTTFNLGANFFDDIAAGLQVRLDIDVDNIGWSVTLAKSTLTTDGSDPGDPTPGAVPEPTTWAMMIGGLGLVGLQMRRRRGKTAVSFA
jgi:hypothetical protein